MMTEEQRYLFDLCGFLHLKNALTPEELDAASEAVRRYIGSAPEDLPPHFGQSGNLKGFAHGFAFDWALEKLVFLPAVWPIVLELTNGKPMLASGTMMVDSPAPGADAALPATSPPGWPHSRVSQRAAGTRNARIGRIGALYP